MESPVAVRPVCRVSGVKRGPDSIRRHTIPLQPALAGYPEADCRISKTTYRLGN